MKLRDLVSVMSSATLVTLTEGKPLDEGGKYLKSYGLLDELAEEYGERIVVCFWPATKDVVEVVIEEVK